VPASLETLIAGSATAPAAVQCRVVKGHHPWRFNLKALREESARLRAGDFVAYVVPLNTPPLVRAMTLATLAFRMRSATRAIENSRMRVIGSYGIDPHWAAPTFVYELNSAASHYADRSLRPRGSARAVRWILARCFGCDPAVGAVAVVGRKR